MFTQEEVNTIIQNRLTREKEKSATENAAALADREAQLQERELKLQLREEWQTMTSLRNLATLSP